MFSSVFLNVKSLYRSFAEQEQPTAKSVSTLAAIFFATLVGFAHCFQKKPAKVFTWSKGFFSVGLSLIAHLFYYPKKREDERGGQAASSPQVASTIGETLEKTRQIVAAQDVAYNESLKIDQMKDACKNFEKEIEEIVDFKEKIKKEDQKTEALVEALAPFDYCFHLFIKNAVQGQQREENSKLLERVEKSRIKNGLINQLSEELKNWAVFNCEVYSDYKEKIEKLKSEWFENQIKSQEIETQIGTFEKEINDLKSQIDDYKIGIDSLYLRSAFLRLKEYRTQVGDEKFNTELSKDILEAIKGQKSVTLQPLLSLK